MSKKSPIDKHTNPENKTYQLTIRIHKECEEWFREDCYQNRVSMAEKTYDLIKKYRAKMDGKK